MKRAFYFIEFKEEANLLDSKSYIIKAFLAVAAAYTISIKSPILKLDIISVLFGLMLTLEPVNYTGLKNGFNQLFATLLGALSTSIIVYFGGINLWTVALAVAFTLYVCLKVDWRAVSPFAIFTSIYMTQYVQRTPAGYPSILLTFRLRMLALVTGILIAIIFNYIFSILFYKNMVKKRILLLLKGTSISFEKTAKAIKSKNAITLLEIRNTIPAAFNNIDWVYALFSDLKKEYKFRSKISGLTQSDMEGLMNIVLYLRNITHLNYDISYFLSKGDFSWEEYDNVQMVIEGEFNLIIEGLNHIIQSFEKGKNSIEKMSNNEKSFIEHSEPNKLNSDFIRIIQNLKDIKKNIYSINDEIFNIKAL